VHSCMVHSCVQLRVPRGTCKVRARV
jgi:hypothetical protein